MKIQNGNLPKLFESMFTMKLIELIFLLVIVSTCHVDASTMTLKEKVLSERSKRFVHLEHAFHALEKQLEKHNSGVRVLEDGRLKSLKSRMDSYKLQIVDASRELTTQVSLSGWNSKY